MFSPLQNVKAIEEGKLWKLKFLEFIGLFRRDNIYALDLACKHGHKNIIDYLIPDAHYYHSYLLFRGCTKGLIYLVKYCIEKLNSLACPYALCESLIKGHCHVADYLLPKCVNIKDAVLYPPHEYMFDEETLNIIKYFIPKGLFTPIEKNYYFIRACRYMKLENVKYCVSTGHCNLNEGLEAVSQQIFHKSDTFKILDIINFLLEKGAEQKYLGYFWRDYLLKEKYFRRWRIIVFKNWFRKVVSPLYFSPGFSGGENEKNLMEEKFTV